MNSKIMAIRPVKAVFLPEEDVQFEILLFKEASGAFFLELTHLDRMLGTFPLELNQGKNEFYLSIPESEKIPGRGFGVSLLTKGGDFLASTAFDLLDPHRKPFRYGFVCDFSSRDGEKQDDILDFFKDFHLTHAQFYDWVYRHHDYRPPAENYRDLMGKEVDGRVVKSLIKNFRAAGTKSIGYGAVYAAGEDYWRSHREYGMDDFRGNPHCLIETFYIMDIRKSSPWNRNIRNQYRYALEDFGFDGLHLDTYGYPKRAWVQKEAVFLEDEFPRFIREVREDFPEAVLVFNNVGNWPVAATGPETQDAVYIEVWDPHTHYHHIRQILLAAGVYKKPVVLAAYLTPFQKEKNPLREGSLTAARLLTAAVASHRGYHLLLGDRGAVLTQGYYNDYSVLTPESRMALKMDYDFLVRYGELFQDPLLIDISETHTAGENREYSFFGAAVSPDGRAGTVWTVVREDRNRKLLSFINLLDQDESEWNRGKQSCRPMETFSVEIPLDGELLNLYFATPDYLDGSARPLEGRECRGIRGPSVKVDIPPFIHWGILFIEFVAKEDLED